MINFVPVQLALLDPLYTLFSWILSNLYVWLGNYGLVVILFTVAVRAILTPWVCAHNAICCASNYCNRIFRKFKDVIKRPRSVNKN